MTITVSADVPQTVPLEPIAPVTMDLAGYYDIPDSSASDDDLAAFEFPARAGTLGEMSFNAGVASDRAPIVLAPYIEADDATTTTRWELAEVTADYPPVPVLVPFPTFPAGTTTARVGLELREPAPVILRRNLFTNPRATTVTNIIQRLTWTQTNPTAGADLIGAITGLRTYCNSLCNATATGSFRGFGFYQHPTAASPAPGIGAPITAGDVVTFSAYVFTDRALTWEASIRFFAGATWSAAATTPAGVAVAANTWTRLTVTATAPAGATHVCAGVWVPAAVLYTTGVDFLRVTAVQIEVAAAASAYFDGAKADTAGEGYRWTGATNASLSQEYDLDFPEPGRELVITDLVMGVEANADAILSAALVRPLRRSVYDVLNEAGAQIAVGTPGLLAGTITYLSATLEDALAIDGVYQFAGVVTLTTGGDLDGLQHMAVGELRLGAEPGLNGRQSRWTLTADVRELAS